MLAALLQCGQTSDTGRCLIVQTSILGSLGAGCVAGNTTLTRAPSRASKRRVQRDSMLADDMLHDTLTRRELNHFFIGAHTLLEGDNKQVAFSRGVVGHSGQDSPGEGVEA